MKWFAIPCKDGTTPEQATYEEFERVGTDLVLTGEYKTVTSFIRYTFTRIMLDEKSPITKAVNNGTIWRLYVKGDNWHYRGLYYDVSAVTKMLNN